MTDTNDDRLTSPREHSNRHECYAEQTAAHAGSKPWSQIQPGDVIEAPSGRLRLVRSVHRSERIRPTQATLRLIHVTLVIGHPSWTGRATTSYSVGELALLGYKLTSMNLPVDDEFTRKLLEDCRKCPPRESWNFRARDVQGVA